MSRLRDVIQHPHSCIQTLFLVRMIRSQADASVSVLDTIQRLFLPPRPDGRAVHRLAMFDATGQITHIVSQMDVIRHLAHTTGLGARFQCDPLQRVK